MRPHSKLVRLLTVLSVAAAVPLGAQIQDNSFLVEEAYNQESRVVQHASTFERADGGGAWAYALAQEWPLFGQRHQLSVAVPYVRDQARGFGDVQVDYRYQLVGDGAARVAVAPRLSVRLPTGHDAAGEGIGHAGAEVGLPVSIVLHPRLVAHTNLSAGWIADTESSPSATALGAGQGLVWLAHPRVNLLVEGVWERETPEGGAADDAFVVSPGIRGAIDVGRLQVVPGIAVPIGVGERAGERSLFLYLSLEHPY